MSFYKRYQFYTISSSLMVTHFTPENTSLSVVQAHFVLYSYVIHKFTPARP